VRSWSARQVSTARFQCVAGGCLLGHEDGSGRVALGQVDVDNGVEERVWPLEHDAGAVAGVRLCARGAAVFEVLEQFEGIRHGLVGPRSFEVDQRADPAVRPLIGGGTAPVGLDVVHR
jgi:hypothetical protein